MLFVDIIGFTSLAEALAPATVLELLRSFHRRMCHIVFAYGGTLDKYIGDAVMATFGTPRPGASDATNALGCALAMLQEVERWNVRRGARGFPALRVGIGIHYGPVVAGNVGDERRMEFTGIGDVVNVANRLERLTRHYGVPLIVSDDLVAAVRAEGKARLLLTSFAEHGTLELRGRRTPVNIWLYAAGEMPTQTVMSSADSVSLGEDHREAKAKRQPTPGWQEKLG